MFLMRLAAPVMLAAGAACSAPSNPTRTPIAIDAPRDVTATDSTPARDGCAGPPAGLSDCTKPLAPGDERACTLTVGGVTRDYLMYAPPSYNACAPAALVVDVHGSSETDAQQAGTAPFLDFPTKIGSGVRLVANGVGFLVAQPQGISNAWTESDTAFMLALPGAVAAQAAVDPTRTFLTGISNGAGLTYWSACSMQTTYTGFAPVSGYADATCPLGRPAPLIHFHTMTDKLVPYSDGQAAFDDYVAAEHCSTGPEPSWQFGGAQTDPRPLCLSGGPPWSLTTCDPSAAVTTCARWSGCDGSAAAMFCTVAPDDTYDGGAFGGHILYFNGTHLSLAAVAWAFWTAP
jgi:predicted esterase